jgi:hypothetical protein
LRLLCEYSPGERRRSGCGFDPHRPYQSFLFSISYIVKDPSIGTNALTKSSFGSAKPCDFNDLRSLKDAELNGNPHRLREYRVD